MAELTGKAVSELTEATSLSDASLFAISASGYSRSISGRTVKNASNGVGEAIPANTDLNSVTTPGVYYVTSTNAPTIANSPFSGAGYRLEVYAASTTDSRYRTQIALTNTADTLYVRNLNNENISPWRRIMDASMLPLSIGNGGTGATTAKNAAVALGLAYEPGDYRHYLYLYGATASATSVRLNAPVSKSLVHVGGVDVTEFTSAYIYGIGGTINGAVTDLSTYVDSSAIYGSAIITFRLTNSNWNLTPYTPITASGYVGFTLT